MEKKERNTQGMSEWDKQTCARLTQIKEEYLSGQIQPGNLDDAHQRLYERIEKTFLEQRKEKAKASFQLPNHAI